MFQPSISLLEIVARTFVVYVLVVLGLRLFGKRELAQLTPFDLVLILTLSNSVQNAMTGPDTSLVGGLVSAATLLTVNWSLNRLGRTMHLFKKWLVGEPTLLVHDGHKLEAHMKREGIDEDELLMATRQHGIESLAGVREAVLEVDGTISIVPQGVESYTSHRKKRTVRER
jgi:uncharacterized membrane protein YcaP (DUF421 family)